MRRPYKQGANPVYDAKPSYNAMKTLTQELGGFTFNKEVSLPDLNAGSDCNIAIFSRGPETRVAAWLRFDSKGEYALPVSDCVLHRVGTTGDTLPDLPISGGPIKTDLTDSPNYYIPAARDDLLTAAAYWQPAPVDIPCQAPSSATLRLTFTNPLSRPIMIKGLPAAVQPGASVQTGSQPIAATRMPVDQYGETDGEFRTRHAFLDLLSPRCTLTQQFTGVVANSVSPRALPPGDGFLLLELQNPSGLPWQGQAHIMERAASTDLGLGNTLSLAQGATDQYFRLPLEEPSQSTGRRIQISAEGGTLTLPVPVPLPWTSGLIVAPGGDPSVSSTQTLSQTTPPEGASPSGTACYQLKFQFASGDKFVRFGAEKQAPPATGRPIALGVWVNGDAQGARLRGRFEDSTKQSFQVDGPKLDRKQWQFVTIPITGDLEHWGGANDGHLHYPITWDWLLIVGTGAPLDGEVYLSDPVLIYANES